MPLSNETDSLIKKISVFKPMQYLGAKSRSISKIVSHSIPYYNSGTVLDLFAGSTLVSQAFSSIGIPVISNDVQKFSSIFANATLKINISKNDLNTATNSLKNIISNNNDYKYNKILSDFILKEYDYISNKDTKKLLELYSKFPQCWKQNKLDNKKILLLIESLRANIGNKGFNIAPLVTFHYGGTYFGIKQSITIDYLRTKIEQEKIEGKLSHWLYNVYLTCLLNVTSKIVHSAGKHFAQPIRPKGSQNTPILNQRLFSNRSYDVLKLFKETVLEFIQHCRVTPHCNSNLAFNKTMEDLLLMPSNLSNVDVIYADPPYTAQQYSRFYHIPEIIINYEIPKLQLFRGAVTKGIYPDKKYHSRFCSKTKAKDAFRDLFSLTKKLDSSLILSYSESMNKETGNERMVDLKTLESLHKEILPNYKSLKINFDFKYRQLNKSEFIDLKKNDMEILIIYSKK